MVTISIIVAVYNAEKTLNRLIDSILKQTYKDFEVLLIDDGSTDCSLNICERISKQDKRFTTYHKSNGGVASTRQFALEKALGKFIIHADPDDWMDFDMLELMLDRIESTQADIVICDYYVDYPNGLCKRISQRYNFSNKIDLYGMYLSGLHGGLWNKLIRKTIIDRSNVSFIKGLNYSEDLIFNLKLIPFLKKVVYLDKAFYHYFQSLDGCSLSGNSNPQLLTQFELFQSNLIPLLRDNNQDIYISQIMVNKLSLLVKSKYSSKKDFNNALNEYPIEWRMISISWSMNMILLIARFVSFKLAKKIYSELIIFKR